MSGIVNLSGLLSAIYSPTSGTGTVSSDPIGALKLAEQNSTKDIAQTAAQPQVPRDIAAFQSAVASATTPAQLLQNPTVLKVLLTANGLANQVPYTALAQKALLSDTTKTGALANTLSNTGWKTTATTYDFANQGLAVIQNPSVIATTTNAYAEVLWRQSLDATTPGLSNALTFRGQASTITSAYQILGDATLRTVVTTALGIPQQIAFQDVATQALAITSRLDISKFSDPKFVEQFTQQYLIQNNLVGQSASTSTASSTTGTNSVVSLYTSGLNSGSADTSDTLASLVVKSAGLVV